MKVCEQRHGILSQWEDFESSLAKIVDFPAFTNEITMIYHDVITDRCVYDFYITKSLFSITCHGTSCVFLPSLPKRKFVFRMSIHEGQKSPKQSWPKKLGSVQTTKKG